MNFYVIAISVSDAIIILVNILVNKHFFNMPIYYIIICGVLGAIGVIAIDGILAFLIRRLPERWFRHDVKFFEVKEKECKIYEKLGIKKWKDHVIELGMFTNFHKDKISDPRSVEYMERFLLESNYGIVIHIADVVLGFLLIFCYPLKYYLCFGVPVAFVNAILSFLPFMILRYNVPRLQRMRSILLAKQK